LRRNNLIFHGINEDDGETWELSESKIIDILETKLKHNIDCKFIERAHRLGRPKSGGNRPIVVKFVLYTEKD